MLLSVELLSVELLSGGIIIGVFAHSRTLVRDRAGFVDAHVLTFMFVVAQQSHLKPKASVEFGHDWMVASTFWIWLQV